MAECLFYRGFQVKEQTEIDKDDIIKLDALIIQKKPTGKVEASAGVVIELSLHG